MMNQIAPIPPPDGGSMPAFLARALADPTLDVSKLEALLRLQREILADEARREFHAAMRAAQAEMEPVGRNAQNTQTNSRYATLEAIDAAIRPIYTQHGFCLSFNGEPIDGPNVRIVCEVSHTGGHSKIYGLEAALDTVGPKGTGNKSPLHGLGSSISYLRRYLVCLVFNIVTSNEDNDGNRLQLRGDRGPTGQLTVDQVADLLDLMRQTGTLERRFLDAMAPGLRTIQDAPASEFPRLRNALLTKRSVLAERAALAPPQGRIAPPAQSQPPVDDRWRNWRSEVRQADAARAANRGTAQ